MHAAGMGGVRACMEALAGSQNSVLSPYASLLMRAVILSKCTSWVRPSRLITYILLTVMSCGCNSPQLPSLRVRCAQRCVVRSKEGCLHASDARFAPACASRAGPTAPGLLKAKIAGGGGGLRSCSCDCLDRAAVFGYRHR